MSDDMDIQHYDHQEASGLRNRGWSVEPPKGKRWVFSLCIGVNGEGCMVRTPRRRCYWCNKTRRLRLRVV